MGYVIYGAGGIGCSIGAALHEAGQPVTLIARGEHLRVLRTQGLSYTFKDKTRILKIAAVAHPSEVAIGEGDVVFMGMKSQDAQAALDALALTASPGAAVVCATNGIETERMALRRFAGVYGMLVRIPAIFLKPGEVSNISHPTAGVLDIGRYPTGTDARAEAIAADLEAAGFSSRAYGDIMRWKAAKLIQNLNTTVEAVFARSPSRPLLIQAARDEAEACLNAAGIAFTSSADTQARSKGLINFDPASANKAVGGSVSQSLIRGAGTTETDFISGEIALLGRLHGVATPINIAVQRMAAQMAAHGSPPSAHDAEAFWQDLQATAGVVAG